MVVGDIVPLVFRLLLSLFRLSPLTPVDFFYQRRAYVAKEARRLGRRVAGALEHLAEELV